jgi:hypothetical protein
MPFREGAHSLEHPDEQSTQRSVLPGDAATALQVDSTSLASAAKPARQNSNYSDWMTPAAAGVGAGVVGSEAYHHEQSRDVPHSRSIEEEQNPYFDEERPHGATSDYTSTNTNNNGISGATYTGTAPLPVLIPTSANVPQSPEFVPYVAETPGTQTPRSPGLDGLEGGGAHKTGAFFPSVVRHDTDMSVSQLHVPGEFPPATPGVGMSPAEENLQAPRPTVGSHGTFVAPSAWDMARE